MSDQPTTAELALFRARCLELHGDTIHHRGRAVQIDELRFVIDCLACGGSGLQQPRPGRHVRGGSITCPRCRRSTVECVGVMAAKNILGADSIDYLEGWDFKRALGAAHAVQDAGPGAGEAKVSR